MALGRTGLFMASHAAGFLSSVLFLIPGFPLIAGLLDLLQHQTLAGVIRLAYGGMVVVAAAFGLSLVTAAVGLNVAPPPPFEVGEAWTLLLRAVASAVGGCGFAILYNSPWRTVPAVSLLSLLGNEVRLGLHDAGMTLAPATFVGALTVGLLASLAGARMRAPRITLTVPGVIIMIPGTYAFQSFVLFYQGDLLEGLRAAVLVGFVVGAMAIGLAVARFVTERGWMIES
jgi:uncharacterized membrane protein YjjB (DUF3815 family)